MTFVQRTKADQSISMNCAVIFVENLQNISVCAKSIGAANAEVCRAGQSREARLLTVPRVAKNISTWNRFVHQKIVRIG
jgi:hypothetical protein